MLRSRTALFVYFGAMIGSAVAAWFLLKDHSLLVPVLVHQWTAAPGSRRRRPRRVAEILSDSATDTRQPVLLPKSRDGPQ